MKKVQKKLLIIITAAVLGVLVLAVVGLLVGPKIISNQNKNSAEKTKKELLYPDDSNVKDAKKLPKVEQNNDIKPAQAPVVNKNVLPAGVKDAKLPNPPKF